MLWRIFYYIDVKGCSVTTIGCVLSLYRYRVIQTPCRFNKISLWKKKHYSIIIETLATISNGALCDSLKLTPTRYYKKGQLVYTFYIKFKLRSYYIQCIVPCRKKGNNVVRNSVPTTLRIYIYVYHIYIYILHSTHIL